VIEPTLTLVVLAKNHEDLAAFQLQHVLGSVDELILLANNPPGFGGLGAVGNYALDHGRCDVVGLVHADTVLGPGALEAFCREAAAGAVTGIVGSALGAAEIWCNDIHETTGVSTLDSCSIFARRDIGVRFDVEIFDGFHCCVEDFCLSAAARGTPAKVPPASGCKHPGTMWKRPAWIKDYFRYRALLNKKWLGTSFFTT